MSLAKPRDLWRRSTATCIKDGVSSRRATGVQGAGPVGAGEVAVAASRGASRLLRPGEVLYVQGTSEDDPPLYAVVDGLLLVERESPRGVPHLLAVLGPGDLAGEVGALDPGPRTARIRAHGPATVAVVPREALLAWLVAHPEAVGPVVRGLSRRVQRTESMLTDIAALGTASRVARLVVELTERLGVCGPDGVFVEHGLTQEQLAGLAGSTRESVNKALRVLARSGWLTHDRGRLLVHELGALRHAAEGRAPVQAGGRVRRRRRPAGGLTG